MTVLPESTPAQAATAHPAGPEVAAVVPGRPQRPEAEGAASGPASDPSSPQANPPVRARLTEALAGPYRSIPVILSLVVIAAFFQSQNSAYLSLGNLTNLALQIVTTSMLALGLVFVLLLGEIDLSVAALSGVAGTIAAQVTVLHGLPLTLGITAAVLTAMAFSFLQALIINFGVPSLIVTLGGMAVLQGGLLVALPAEFSISVGGTPIADVAGYSIPVAACVPVAAVGLVVYAVERIRRYRTRRGMSSLNVWAVVVLPVVAIGVVLVGIIVVFGQGKGLPLPIAILLAMLLTASYVTTQTRYGVHLYAAGGNRDAARRAGIPVGRMVIFSFLILGACGAMAGIVDASRVLGVSVSSGSGPLILNAIAAAVVGGVSLFGGRGSVWAALLGSLVIGSISNGVQLLALSTQVQLFATGFVLVASVAIDVVLTRGRIRPLRH